MTKHNGDTDAKAVIGPTKGNFIPPPEVEERDERADVLPAAAGETQSSYPGLCSAS